MECLNKQNSGNPLVNKDIKIDLDLECQSSPTTETVHANNSMHTSIVSASSHVQCIDDGYSGDADIASFFSRKVKIATQQWSVTTSYVQILNPWNLYLNNPAVKNKLQNYQLIKGDLKLTIFVNGTPFHLGMLLASYNYLGAGGGLVTIGGDTQLVTRSQRPHIFLNVSTGKGGCLCLPFFLPTNYLSLTDPLFDSSGIGTLNIDSFAPLAQINGGTDTVTVTVFAEMINVKLTGPTMGLVALSGNSLENFDFTLEPQSKDEYNNSGVISGPASAIAAAAGALTSIPGIAPFALATQIGANAIGGIARLFGYSRPIQIGDVMPMRNFPISSLALTEGADTSQKLTMTGKAEICVDPATVGLPSDDDMLISTLAQRESYITSFAWDVTHLVDDVIFSMDVDPMAERRSVVAGGYSIIPTSLSYATRLFSAWSGSMKYRFQVIGSQFHRGRLAIVYDPKGPFTGDPFNTTFNTILDLADARDFTVEMKWQQDRAYMEVSVDNTRTFYTTTTPETRVPLNTTCNGAFYVVVVNELVVPDSVTPVRILVSMSAGSDYEVVNPNGCGMNVSTFAPIAQSGESFEDFDFTLEVQSDVEQVPITENAPEQMGSELVLTSAVKTTPLEKPLVYYGERVVSMRQLLKRYTYFRTINYPSTNLSQRYISFLLKQMPAESGYNTSGPDVTGSASAYNYAATTYINYLKPAYAGWRGSIRWKFIPLTRPTRLEVTRMTGSENRLLATNYRARASYTPTTADTVSQMAAGSLFDRTCTGAGTALTQCRTMDALEVEIPYTTPLRFSKTKGDFQLVNSNSLAAGYPGGDSFILWLSTDIDRSQTAVDTFVAAGEDFTLFGWIGAPVLYSAAIPAS